MDSMRIELIECFITEADAEYWENLKIAPPYKCRRIYPCLTDIDYPREIPDDKEHAEILFKDGSVIIVKGDYQSIFLQIDDREAQAYGEDW
jgi:hypothetical protein